MAFPNARTSDLISERVGDETVVLDSRTGVAHCLSPVLAAVWSACDGASDAGAIAGRTGLQAELVGTALTELDELALLDEPEGTGEGLSRRDALGRLARRGAVASTLPLAYSLAVGTPANADSRTCAQQTCNTNLACVINATLGGGCRGSSTCGSNGRCVF